MLEFITKGGVFMWAILAASILVFAVILERLYTIRRNKFFGKKSLKSESNLKLKKEGYDKAFIYLREELEHLARPNIILSTMASISPLLGLLGTVSGMIKVFANISIGGLGDPAQLASGISEALFTTAAGLVVAIPAFIAFKFFQSRIKLYAIILENTILEEKGLLK